MKKFFLPALLIILFLLSACNLPTRHTPTRPAATPEPRATATPLRPTRTATKTALPPTDTPQAQAGVSITGTSTYDLAFEVTLINNGSGTADRIRLVVALISDREPFQRVLSSSISHPYKLETDEYDNQFAVFEFTDFLSGEETTIRFEYRVEVNALAFDLGNCNGSVVSTDLLPEDYIESDAPDIISEAQTLGQGQSTLCQKARAYYDFVGDNLTYAGYNPGDLGAEQALQDLSGDCTEFSDLVIALSRAGGIPARSVEGLTCCTVPGQEYSAGDTKHNWALVNLPQVGWAPLDPTWGRWASSRDEFFAAIDDQHIILTIGRNPEAMNGYHGFTYTWWGSNVQIENEEAWSVLEVVN